MTSTTSSKVTRAGSATALALVLAAIIALVFGLLSARPAHAAAFTVNSGADAVDGGIGDGVCATATGDCTLRAAVQEANATLGADTITFSVNSVTLSTGGRFEDAADTGDLDITDDVTIDGSGVTIGADPDFDDRIFHIVSPAKATVENVTVTGGEEIYGGGIAVTEGAALDLSGSTVQNNTAVDLSDHFPFALGGGIYNAGSLTVTKSTIRENYSQTVAGSAHSSGGGLYNVGAATITFSTIDSNYTSSPGGTPDNGGGGVYNDGNLTLTNNTISGNSTNGFGLGGGISNGSTVTVTNTTIYDNSAIAGDNLFNRSGGNFYVKNTIVATSSGRPNCLAEPGSLLNSQGSNLEYPGPSCGFTGTGDIQNQDPGLGPLTTNGGPTKTRALLAGSPAIDAGTNTGCPATDQREITRPQDGDNNGSATCDIGAFEVDATAPNTTIDEGPSGPVSSTSATFEFSSDEPGTTFSCSLDGSSFTPCYSPKTYTGLSSGPHTFEVYARDAVGNVDPDPAERTFTVDTTAPDTTITIAPTYQTNDNTPTFTFGGSDDLTAQADLLFSYKVDNDNWSDYQSATSATLASLPDGSHPFYVKAKDAAGNEDPDPAKHTFTVDTIAPTVEGVTPDDGALKVRRFTNVTVTFSEKMQPGTLGNHVTLVNTRTGSQEGATGMLSRDDRTLTLEPLATLAKNTRYEARVEGGTGGVKDPAGNPLGADKVWSFTTGAK